MNNNTELPSLSTGEGQGVRLPKKIKNMKRQNIRIFGIAAMMAISSMYLPAQVIHEFSAYGGGGLSTLQYKLTDGNRSGRMGGDFGMGYTFINANWQAVETGTVSSAQWGLHTGIGFGLYNAIANLKDVKTHSSSLKDDEGDDFYLHTTLSKYKEMQNAWYLNIPVMGLYQTTMWNQLFYGMGGLKFGIPLSSKFKVKNTMLENEAEYYKLENSIKEPQFAGYGKFNKSFDGNIGLDFSLIMALEGGVKWRISNNLHIYTGLYFDYGLNNASKGSYKEFVNFPKNNPSDFTTNSALTSYSNSNPKELKMFTEKIHLMAVGVKVRIALEK